MSEGQTETGDSVPRLCMVCMNVVPEDAPRVFPRGVMYGDEFYTCGPVCTEELRAEGVLLNDQEAQAFLEREAL